MAGKIKINSERCKGCGLCVTVCPKHGIIISKTSNKSGYFPAQHVPSVAEGCSKTDCTGCAMCAIVCPDAVIEVYRDEAGNEIVEIEPPKKHKANLAGGKV